MESNSGSHPPISFKLPESFDNTKKFRGMSTSPQFNQSLGVSIKVSSELKDSLRSSSIGNIRQTRDSACLTTLSRRRKHDISSEGVKAKEKSIESNHEMSEDKDRILEVLTPKETLDDETAEVEYFGGDLLDSPPPSLPIIVVNLENLCGYVPTSKDELDAVIEQVESVLNEDEFDRRVGELFEMSVVHHAENSANTSNSYKEIVVHYPEILCHSDGRVLSTPCLWKKFFRKHSIPVLNKLIAHLKECNRSLIWKSDMYDAILDLAKRESDVMRQTKLWKWRVEERKIRLDKLYQVRETFDHRLENARIKLEQLEDEREQMIAQHGGLKLQALDLSSNIFSDSGPLQKCDLTIESDTEEAIETSMNDSALDTACRKIIEVDESSIEDEEINMNPHEDQADAILTEHSNSKSGKSKKKKHGKNLVLVAKLEQEKKMLEDAWKEENELLEKFTSDEMKRTQALVQSLQLRMQQVDDLLESLQDEEWADEEDGIASQVHHPENDLGDEISLLDQILAMILGSLRPLSKEDCTKVDPESHFSFLRKEHEDILVAWKNYFGRLPYGTKRTERVAKVELGSVVNQDVHDEQVSSLRSKLGILDNDGDWDHDSDESSVSSKPAIHENINASVQHRINAAPKVQGLRPGSRLLP